MKFKVWNNGQWVVVSHRQVRRRIGTRYRRMIGPFGPAFNHDCLFDGTNKDLTLEEVQFRCNHGSDIWYTKRDAAYANMSKFDRPPTFAQIMEATRELA